MISSNHMPKYQVIKKKIEDLINEGRLASDNKIPTEKELAERYTASRHTVRKALEMLEQEGVLYKRQGIGTFYNQHSQKTTRLIGYISISLYDYIFADILNGVDDVLHQNGYQILLGNSRDDQLREKEILEAFLKRDVDGLILEPAKGAYNYPNLPLLDRYINREIPVVILDTRFNHPGFSYITVNDLKGGYIATEYLIKAGHRYIGIIYKALHLPAINRYKGYKKALEAHNLPVYNDYVKQYYHSEFTSPEEFEKEVTELTLELINLKQRPTAIFCFNDQIAILVKEILSRLNYHVPKDISIIGYDDSQLVKLGTIAITSVAHPKKKAGKKAASIILDRILKNKKDAEDMVFEPVLIERDSVSKIGVNINELQENGKAEY
jgi:GntR family transcriptional regulator, arabinose operon transcriptional repressor